MALAFQLSAAQDIFAKTINVPADQATIQAGINAASDGDVILVAPGTYFEMISISNDVELLSSAGAETTTINGFGAGPVVSIGGEAVLSGFTITGGYNSFDNSPFGDALGGGITIHSGSPTISHNIIENNAAAGGGGGIAVIRAGPLIESNTIANNTQRGGSGGSGGGILLRFADGVQILSNTIVDNSWTSGDGGGISIENCSPFLMDNSIAGNLAIGIFSASQQPIAAGGGIAIEGSSSAVLVQNLIVQNTADFGGGFFFLSLYRPNAPLLVNNTIARNSATQSLGSAVYALGFDHSAAFYNNLLIGVPSQNAVFCDAFDPTPPIFQYNDGFSADGFGFDGTCSASANHSGNISADPLFVDTLQNNYRLGSTSPALDAGLNSAPDIPVTDFYGEPRIDSDGRRIIDLGISEFDPSAAAEPGASISPATRNARAEIDVPADQPTIQGAIDAALDGTLIRVAPGIYLEVIDFRGKAIRLISTDGPNVTTINGHGTGPVVSFTSGESPSSMLSGFTITGGVESSPGVPARGAILIENSSPTISGNVITANFGCAGIEISSGSPLIRSNRITNNTGAPEFKCAGGNAGGIAISGSGSAQILGNQIHNNSSWGGDFNGGGGGVSLYKVGQPLLMNNLISGNNSELWAGGVDIGADSSPRLIQNLITYNHSGFGGGIFIAPQPASPLLLNNTIANNQITIGEGSALYVSAFNSGMRFLNNLFSGGPENAIFCYSNGDSTYKNNDAFSTVEPTLKGACNSQWSNISGDPLFANPLEGDYHLMPRSRAIDAGSNDAPNVGSIDYYGNARIVPGYSGLPPMIDIGAAEFPTAGHPPNGQLMATPDSIRFGKLTVGITTVPALITVTASNQGGMQPVTLGAPTITSDGNGVFTVVGGSCKPGLALVPGSSCTLKVTFTPVAAAVSKGTLALNGNNYLEPSPLISMKGTGLPLEAAVLDHTPKSLNFGGGPVAFTIGTAVDSPPIIFRNTGPVPVAIGEIAVTGKNPTDFLPSSCPPVLAPGLFCDVHVLFTPTGRGHRKAKLVLTTSAKPGMIIVPLSAMAD